AIARAILDKPDWLFLDEATSALDEKLEGEIYRMLREVLPNTTIVSIGHRSTLIALHRRHIEMEPGRGGVFEPTPTIGVGSSSASVHPCCGWALREELSDEALCCNSRSLCASEVCAGSLSLISGAMPVLLPRTRTSTASPRSRVDTWRVG